MNEPKLPTFAEFFKPMTDIYERWLAQSQAQQSEIEALRTEIERLKQGASVVRVRFCPIDTEETFEGKVIHESNYSYVVIPDDNLTGTARWSKKYCEIIPAPPSRG